MSFIDALAPVKDWTRQGGLKTCVAVDIGGSGLRIRISNALDANEFVDLGHYKAKSSGDAYSILGKVEEALETLYPDFESRGGAMAIAGPIANGEVVVTNWPGDAAERTIKVSDLPSKLFPSHRTVLLNDLEAGAYGILATGEKKCLDERFTQMWTDVAPSGPILSDSRTAVLAMGSGYGVAIIVKNALLKEAIVLPSELGHLQIPLVMGKDPTKTEEWEFVQFVSDFYYNGTQCPEYEDISSARGLRLAYQYFVQKSTGEVLDFDAIDAGDVAERAKSGDRVALEALKWHYKLFIRSAKEIATTFNCDSVVLALDNQVKNWWFVSSISDVLKDEFYNFIRPDWMKGIRVYAQTSLLNFNILGTDYMAHRISSN
jgi:glucokinase